MNLNFHQLSFGPFGFVCTRDILAVQFIGASDNFQRQMLTAKRMAATLLDIHSYCAFPRLPALDLMAETWFEVKDSGPRTTVFGYADSSLDFIPLVSGHLDNQPFVQAVGLLEPVGLEPGLGPAFADFRVARRQTGSYAAFYAFRTLEHVGYTFGVDRKGGPDWDVMNAALGTSKDYWRPLTKAGEAARDRPAETSIRRQPA